MRQLDTTIGQRLALGFGVILCLLLAVVGFYFYGQDQQSAVTRQLTQQIMPRADAANDVQTALLRQSVAGRSYVFSGDPHDLQDYQQAEAQAQQALQQLAAIPETPEGQTLFDQIRVLAVQYMQDSDRAIALRQEGNVAEAQRIMDQEMANTRSELVDRVEAFVNLQLSAKDEAGQEIARVQEETRLFSALMALLALVSGALLAVFTARSISVPVGRLVQASRALSGGDYSSAIDLSSAEDGRDGQGRARDEVRELASAFGSAASMLLDRERQLLAQAKLSSSLASSIEVRELAHRALVNVASHVQAELGMVYVFDPETSLLQQAGGYSVGDGAPATVKMGDGILGEAAASRQLVLVRDIPSDTPFRVKLGFDQVIPRMVVALPLVCQDQLVGAMLLASLRDLSDDAMDFVDTATNQLAVSLQNALSHGRVRRLAEELQDKNELLAEQNEELQAQSEEIQAQNEELQAQSEEIQEQNEELQAQTEELQTQNDKIQAQAEELSSQNVALEWHAARLARLQEIAGRLSQSLSPGEVLERVVGSAGDLLGSHLAAVLLLDESRSFFTVAAAIGLEESRQGGLRLSAERSLAGRVMEQRRSLFIEDVSHSPEVQFPSLAGEERLGSVIVAPMVAEEKALGVVEVYFGSPRRFSQDEVDLLSALASAAAVAVRNARLFDDAEQQRRMLESVLAEIPEAVYVADSEGRPLIANAAARSMFGVDDRLATGGEDGGSERKPACPELAHLVAAALQGERVLGQEVRYTDVETGLTGHAQVSSVPILKGGRVTSVVAVAADISRLKEVERAKDEFLSMASHELKSPLTSVKGFSQLLEKRLEPSPGDQNTRRMLQNIVEQTDRVVRLVNRLLDLSRVQMGRLEIRPEPTDLAGIVRSQLRAAQVKTEKHRLVADIPDQVVGEWDPGYLEEVTSNLLDNALRYSPKGGEVRLSLRQENGSARLSISDQGIGIPPEVLPRLFRRHFRSDEAKRIRSDGLGIGLYLAREIVLAHGGRIWVDSEPGVGSTFTVELPCHPDDPT